MILGLIENGEPASALSNSSTVGNYSSGALLNIGEGDVPYTFSLHNFGRQVEVENPPCF